MGNFLTVTGKEWSKNKTCTRPFGWAVMFTWFLCCPDNFIYVLHCITLMYKQFIFVCFAHLYNKIWIKMLFSTLCKNFSFMYISVLFLYVHVYGPLLIYRTNMLCSSLCSDSFMYSILYNWFYAISVYEARVDVVNIILYGKNHRIDLNK